MRLHTIASVCLMAFLASAASSQADVDSDLPADASPVAPRIGAPQFEDSAKVGRLIEDLGSKRFIARRQAEKQLLEIGMKAFDQIDASTEHADPEVAASCNYLVSELTVRWTRRDDVPQVKSALNGFANFDDARRLSVVQSIARQNAEWAISPLCRICRYDSSPSVSRQAAIELLSSKGFELDYASNIADQLRSEIGTSVRPAATWIRLLAAQIENPRATLAEWPVEIERAVALADPEETGRLEQISQLVRNYARVALECRDGEAFVKAVDRFLELTNNSKVVAIEQFLDWAVQAEAPELVTQLVENHRDVLVETKAGLYLMAKTQFKQSNPELAEQLADQAFEMVGQHNNQGSAEMRVEQGGRLLSAGHVQWGRRELYKAIEVGPKASVIHARAVDLLSDSLHDSQEDTKAVEVLSSLLKPIREDSDLYKQYENSVRTANRMGNAYKVPSIKVLESNQHFFEACALKAEGDTEKKWQALDKAYKLNEENIDILIAMYHSSKQDKNRRSEVMKEIAQRCRSLEQRINDYAGTSPFVNTWYNEWAWLVSNTEGDFDKAIRFSHKSIELYTKVIDRSPELSIESTAGLLDTLGRCYFAAGDLDNAIKYQAQAVEYNPHLQTLKRQLQEFRRAKSAQQG